MKSPPKVEKTALNSEGSYPADSQWFSFWWYSRLPPPPEDTGKCERVLGLLLIFRECGPGTLKTSYTSQNSSAW